MLSTYISKELKPLDHGIRIFNFCFIHDVFVSAIFVAPIIAEFEDYFARE
jgi:hypothetical protein